MRIRRITVPIHIILTFFWERLIFSFNDDWSEFCTISLNEDMSNLTEKLIFYCLSKLLAVIIIYLFWKCIFYVADNFGKAEIKIFFGVFLLGLFLVFICWPVSFGYEIDNYWNFMHVLALKPYYWHSVYTGCLYAACMMVLPLKVSIAVFQWLCFVCLLYYAFKTVRKNNRYMAWLVFTVFLLPETYYLIVNPYRNNYYCMLALFYVILIQNIRMEKKSLSLMGWVGFLLLSAFVAIYRSEGFVLGICGLLIILISDYGKKLYRYIVPCALLLVCMQALSFPQKIGNIKYYGSDYFFVSATAQLPAVLNDKNINSSYKGYEEDIAAIEKIIPLDMLKSRGLEGYRSENYARGHGDFNQTCADSNEQSNFKKAYVRLIIHNIWPYAKNQLNYFLSSMGIGFRLHTDEYEGKIPDTPVFVYDQWETGREIFYSDGLTRAWKDNGFRKTVFKITDSMRTGFGKMCDRLRSNVALHLFTLISNTFFIVYSAIKGFKRKDKTDSLYGMIAIVILLQLGIVIAGMPEPRGVYLYPYLYCSYWLILSFIVQKIGTLRHGARKEI